LQPNQQVRIDIVDPSRNYDPATGVLRTDGDPQPSPSTAILRTIFVTRPSTTFGLIPASLSYIDLRALLILEGLTPAQADARLDLTSLVDRTKDRQVLIRISMTNNKGKLVAGVDDVHATDLYNDFIQPTIGGLRVRNRAFDS